MAGADHDHLVIAACLGHDLSLTRGVSRETFQYCVHEKHQRPFPTQGRKERQKIDGYADLGLRLGGLA
jgi:hypothetical protein